MRLLGPVLSQANYHVFTELGQLFNTFLLSPPFVRADVVPAPKNLRFSEVTQTSFRVTWDHGAPDVALYRLGWVKKGSTDMQYVSAPCPLGAKCALQKAVLPVLRWRRDVN